MPARGRSSFFFTTISPHFSRGHLTRRLARRYWRLSVCEPVVRAILTFSGRAWPTPGLAAWISGIASCGAGFVSGEGVLKQGVGETEFVLPRMGWGHGDANAAGATRDLGADLEQLEPDRATCGTGEPGLGDTDSAESTEQDIGDGGEPEAQLFGTDGNGRGAVGARGWAGVP